MDAHLSMPGIGIRVLVTDRDEDLAVRAARSLHTLDYAAMSSHEGYHALALAQSFLPHIVLLDLELPSLNGFEIARRLRDRASSRPMHLVALTGREEPEYRALASATGFEAFLPKPFDLKTAHDLFIALVRGELGKPIA